MEGRETPQMRKYGESKTAQIMMATVPHVTSGSGLRKFQADGFLLDRVYKIEGPNHLKPTLSCAYPYTIDNTLRKNPTNALIYINTTLFTLLHCYMFQLSRGHPQGVDTLHQQGQQNTCPDVNIKLMSSVLHVT